MKRKNAGNISTKLSQIVLSKIECGYAVISLIGIISLVAIGLQTNVTSVYIGIAAIIISFLIFSFLTGKAGKKFTHSISEPIGKITSAADSIANGNLDVDFPFFMEGEMKGLTDGLKDIIRSIKLMKTDINTLEYKAANGNLDVEVDLSRHSGDYRKMMESVNSIFKTLKEPLDVTSDFVEKLADGVHQDDINNTYKGYYAVLIENLNRARRSLNILVDETAKLAEAGHAGNLEIRGDDSKLKGTYAKVIHGVNETFDTFKVPLDAASDFISGLAAGTVTQPIENIYKGYYANFIDNLNHVLESLHYLFKESASLVEAGKNGNLTVNSDTSKVPGNYARIVDGMNGILKAVSVPLNQANNVLGKIAVNDYTTLMNGEYKGTFANLEKSINSVIGTLQKVEKLFLKVSMGDLSMYETYKSIGKRCENDKMIPAGLTMMQAIKDLIATSDKFAASATQGNLKARPDLSKFNGGYRQIIEGMIRTLEAVAAPIEESAKVLQSFSQGDLTAEMTGKYQGEYSRIKDSLNKTIAAFHSVLSQINVAANQVTAGSSQVSSASQALSQGATEQASSVEELTSSITEVAAQVRENAQNAKKTSEITQTLLDDANRGNSQMKQMLNSMQEINEGSTNISKIIKVIDEIAFQTNILSLNAAVEAARAGQAGKGFAVVADEVRNLAAKSANAAKETTALIEGNISKVSSGTKIANDTALKLDEIVKAVEKSASFINRIAEASNQQATAISQIDTGIEQVSTVVQNNSATAEESAASSEELSGQADSLKQLVNHFKLRNNSDISCNSPKRIKNSEPSENKNKVSQETVENSLNYGKY